MMSKLTASAYESLIDPDILLISNQLKKENVNLISQLYWELRAKRRDLTNKAEDESDSDNQDILLYFRNMVVELEQTIKPSLKRYCGTFRVGEWALSQMGLGPITVTRLLHYIDIDKARTPEHLWSYAGLMPDNKTYNNSLKEVCIEIGKSFVKYSDKENCFYGNLYLSELERRTNINDSGGYLDLAKEESIKLDSAKKSKSLLADKLIYDQGKLPASRIASQAQRYAIKIFLAHWHAVQYREAYGFDYQSSHKNIISVPDYPF